MFQKIRTNQPIIYLEHIYLLGDILNSQQLYIFLKNLKLLTKIRIFVRTYFFYQAIYKLVLRIKLGIRRNRFLRGNLKPSGYITLVKDLLKLGQNRISSHHFNLFIL